LGNKLDHLNDDKPALKNAKASEIARIVDITEKYHGARGGDSDIDPRQWAERTDWMREALEELQARQDRRQQAQDVVD
jgi:hypothetical protein